LSPGRSSTNYGIGLILLAEADAPAALAAMERENTEGFRLTGLAMAHHALHDTEASDAALNELIDKHATTGPAQIAEVYAFRGDVEAAFFWLDKAVEYHDGGILYMQSNPVLTALHDDPRWETILNKMGL
jgi:adenylate cyclase